MADILSAEQVLRQLNSCPFGNAPPWKGFLMCVVGGTLVLWGWGNDRRMPYSLIGFIGGLALWSIGLITVLPWSIS